MQDGVGRSRPRGHGPGLIAAGTAAAVVATVILSLLIWIARGMADMPVSYGRTPIGVLGLVLSPICYAAVGGILGARLPRNPIGWLFLLMSVSLGIMLPVNLLVTSAHDSLHPAAATVVWLAWLRTTFGTPVVLSVAVVAVQLFPNGRTLPGRWAAGVWLGLVGGLILQVATAIDPVGLITYPTLPNPMALPYVLKDAVNVVRSLGVGLVIAAAGVAVASIWLRYRHGDAVCRAQLRWIVLAVAVTVAAGVPFVIARYVLRATDDTGELLSAIAQVGSCAFPLAAAFAISRYRLFEVDVVIERTLVYLPMMAILGGMYTGGIALLQRIFVAVTGSESEAAIVMTILVVASVFTPLRRSLESMVDRRFAGHGHANGAGPATPWEGQPLVAPGRSTLEVAKAGAVVRAQAEGRGRSLSRAHLATVAADGGVNCPLGSGRTIRDCLSCPYLEAVGDAADLTIVCRPPTGL